MTRLRLQISTSVQQFRTAAHAWDDLWQRSDDSLPTSQAELVALWVEHFSGPRQFAALAVERGDQMIAGLPLVEGCLAGQLPVGTLCGNSWSSAGDLLLDAGSDEAAALDLLLSGIDEIGWPLLWLQDVEFDAPRWRALLHAVAQRRRTTVCHAKYDVGVVDIADDWHTYEQRWSGNHRGAIRRSRRKIEKEGDVELRSYHDLKPHQVAPLLQAGFEIEDKSWKGEAGSSVLQTPEMSEFFLRQARELARGGQLELYFLDLNGEPIAFEYCYGAKGTCFSHKLGYDPAFARFGPGRLLRYLQLEQCFADRQWDTFDTMGLLCEAKAKWCNRSYPVGRLVAQTGNLTSLPLIKCYQAWRNLAPKMRRGVEYTAPKLGAAGEPAVDLVHA